MWRLKQGFHLKLFLPFRNSFIICRNLTEKLPGVYGLQNVVKPKDWNKITKEALEKTDKIIANLSASLNSKDFDATRGLQELDEISNTLCSVIDPAELCRNSHPNEEFVEEATNAVNILSSKFYELNANKQLHLATVRIMDKKQDLSEEQISVAENLKKEFETYGIHLPDKERKKVIALQEKIFQLSSSFQKPITEDISHSSFKVPLKDISISNSTLESDSFFRSLRPDKQGYVSLSTHEHILSPVLKFVKNAEVRKKMFIYGNSLSPENILTLEKLIQTRRELSQTLGFNSYAHMILSHLRVAKDPDQVIHFLVHFANKIKPIAQSQLNLLRNEKLLQENSTTIHGWDKIYYMESVISKRFDKHKNDIPGYFTIRNCIQGLQILVKTLFDINVEEVPKKEWASESWHPSVVKLRFSSSNETIGYVYLDLIARRGKFSHPSTFAIQFPKVDPKDKSTLVQIPRVCILCSFEVSQKQPYILHSELETLLHEFGHCLSALLSRTEYQHVAGTRAALDFIETPSTFMEYFAWDHRFLSSFAKHFETAQILPKATLNKWKETKHIFSAIEGLTTVCNALFDMIIHGPFPFQLPSGKKTTSTTKVLLEIENEFSVIPFVEGTHWHSRFGHLIGYGAGYYSYVFCKIFSSNIWHSYFKSNPLNRESGDLYQKKVLRFGGSKDPQQLLNDYLKSNPLDDENYVKDLIEDTVV